VGLPESPLLHSGLGCVMELGNLCDIGCHGRDILSPSIVAVTRNGTVARTNEHKKRRSKAPWYAE